MQIIVSFSIYSQQIYTNSDSPLNKKWYFIDVVLCRDMHMSKLFIGNIIFTLYLKYGKRNLRKIKCFRI